MSKKLIIVESPGKIKTIQTCLGTGYEVASCYGHIRDLPKNKFGVDIAAGFKPTYVTAADKKNLIASLKKQAQRADSIWLASDDDREGEAIAWHVKEVLQLPDHKVHRVVFRSITKSELKNFEARARAIDLKLVQAQEARRIVDRIVGYELSPILWEKIKAGLSAGRVQSVAVKLIVEREREIDAFVPEASFKITGHCILPSGEEVKIELPKAIKDYDEAKTFLTRCRHATYTIEEVKQTQSSRLPTAPFTTSTLQQAAFQQLGYSVKQTMVLAQQLYEAGKITYMRTDAVFLAPEAQQQIKKVVLKTYGPEYYAPRTYQPKAAYAQEAHEAIRPTDFAEQVASTHVQAQKLYTLIRHRALASQMAEALFDKTTATITISTLPDKFLAKGAVMKFPGFLAVYQQEEEENLKVLPPLALGQTLNLRELQAKETFTKAPGRYTEASLVKKLEELGIGRPATYAPILTTIQQKRGYVEKASRPGGQHTYRLLTLANGQLQESQPIETTGSEKNKLYPTDIGIVVNDFLNAHCQEIMDYTFTAKTEEDLDKVAEDKLPQLDMLETFYKSFSKQVERATQIQENPTPERVLGTDPVTGKPVIARLSKRYGPLVQIGSVAAEEKPRFASLPPGQLLEKITLEQALALFALPRTVGHYEGADITAHIGRFGPYLKHKEAFYSLTQGDPYTIEEDEAILVLQRKKSTKEALKTFTEDPTLSVWNGRFGPYIKTPTRNVSLPKGIDPHTLSIAEAKEIVANAPPPRKKLRRK